ncbi:hypothetical protein AZE42_03159, partial [Rhizopogon vesiculosus]
LLSWIRHPIAQYKYQPHVLIVFCIQLTLTTTTSSLQFRIIFHWPRLLCKRHASTEEQEEGISLLALRVKPTSVIQHAPPEEPSIPKFRLVIHRMVLINLKTYAGGQEVGPFHQMRQGKLSKLIYNPPGPDVYPVVQNSSLVVVLTTTKWNTSRYMLNPRSSTLAGSSTPPGARNRPHSQDFLILPGEVESMTQMKPKGTAEHDNRPLEYLGDIIGTAALKAPIETALAEVDLLTEERGRWPDCGS